MVNFTILAGGYDVFIASYLLNLDAGSLTVTGRFPSASNPSWITPGIGNRSILYATNENPAGGLQSFTVTPNGVVSSAFETISSGGDSPAFAGALSSGYVAVMNYNSGDGRIVPLTEDGLGFDNSAGLIKFPVPTAPTSEGVSHPHMALEVGEEVFVPDLGGDKIWRLSQNYASGNWEITGSIPQPPSSGPRHIAVHDDRLFTLHELASTLTVQDIPTSPNGTSALIDNVSILPDQRPAGASYAAAEILIPKPTSKFSTPYIYVSNRNVGTQDSKGDSIAIFELVNKGTKQERLQLIKQVFTGLDQIRGMEIGFEENGSDEFLIAAGVAGNAGTVVYRRVDGGRDLQEVARNLDIPTRTSFIWL